MSDPRGIGPPDYCWFHGEEPMPDDCYVTCGECGHYWTAEALEDRFEEMLGFQEPASRVYACPLCAHDF